MKTGYEAEKIASDLTTAYLQTIASCNEDAIKVKALSPRGVINLYKRMYAAVTNPTIEKASNKEDNEQSVDALKALADAKVHPD